MDREFMNRLASLLAECNERLKAMPSSCPQDAVTQIHIAKIQNSDVWQWRAYSKRGFEALGNGRNPECCVALLLNWLKGDAHPEDTCL